MAPSSDSVLLPSGDNIFDVAPELAAELHSFRATVNAKQAWPVTGDRIFKHFHQFADIPKDVRHKIWVIAANDQPRVVAIYKNRIGRLRCTTPAPKLLHLCSESRKAALLVYEPLVISSTQTYTYVNFKIDIIFFDTDSRLPHAFGANPFYPIFQEKVYNLAVHKDLLEAHKNDISQFVRLKELALVTVPSYYYNDDSHAHDLGKVNFFTMAAPKNYYDSNHPLFQKRADLPTLSALLDILIKNVPIPMYRLLDVHRAGAPRSMTEAEKEVARMQRKDERDSIAPFRLDEDLAIRTQYALDHRMLVLEGGIFGADTAGEMPMIAGEMPPIDGETATTTGNSTANVKANLEGEYIDKGEASDDDHFGIKVVTDIDILSDDFLMYLTDDE